MAPTAAPSQDTLASNVRATVAEIEIGTMMVDGVSTFFRRLAGDGPPTVFVHGNPTNSEDWRPFLERIQGPALAFDLPGWGRSARPSPAEFDYSMDGLARFTSRFLQRMAVDRYSLVVHDWGAVGLIAAQEEPARVRRLVIINAVALLPGYRWHRTARIWRTRRIGELSRLAARRPLVDLGLRESRGGLEPAHPACSWTRCSRSSEIRPASKRSCASTAPRTRTASPPPGARLGTLTCPALVVWGLRDRYLPARFGAAYAAALPSSKLVEFPGAGHWPWIEDPGVVDRVVRFLTIDEEFAPA